jgi:hypothetical protein
MTNGECTAKTKHTTRLGPFVSVSPEKLLQKLAQRVTYGLFWKNFSVESMVGELALAQAVGRV